MSSHQRRIVKRFQLRLKLLAIFAWMRKQAMSILKARRDRPEPILTDSQKLVAAARKLPASYKAGAGMVFNGSMYRPRYNDLIRTLSAELSAGLL